MGPRTTGERRRQLIERLLAAHATGDVGALLEAYADDAVTEWPQSGERLVGGLACARVAARQPGGPPSLRVRRIVGSGRTWVAYLSVEYADASTWQVVSVFEFAGERIVRRTDVFGPPFAAPDWRVDLVEPRIDEGDAA